MHLDHRIYVAGHTGMVGGAIWRHLRSLGYRHLLGYQHRDLDLTEQQAVIDFFQQTKPDYVFLAAAKVGGILANANYPAEFVYQNLAIQTNIIHAAMRVGVKRLLFLGSSCIYPRDCLQPIEETALLSGPLEKTNRPYAVAKIAGIEMCWAYYRQYGCRFLTVMPTNLYGPADHYDLQNSHVIPGLLQKFHLAKIHDEPSVSLWGTGNPRREFLYCEDAADACVFLMNLSDESYSSLFDDHQPPIVNVGCGQDFTIRDLARQIANMVGYSGEIIWDSHQPDGTPRKLLAVSRLEQLGWRAKVSLIDGLKLTYHDFQKRFVELLV